MDTFGPNPNELEFSGMPSLEAREIAREQAEICEMLFTQEVTSVDQINPSKIRQVQMHMVTCRELHHPIPGLMFIED